MRRASQHIARLHITFDIVYEHDSVYLATGYFNVTFWLLVYVVHFGRRAVHFILTFPFILKLYVKITLPEATCRRTMKTLHSSILSLHYCVIILPVNEP